MSEKLMDVVEKILDDEEDVIVPVKKIWKMFQFSKEFQNVTIPALIEFSQLLKDDERFEFMPPVNYSDMFEGLSEEEQREREDEMETLGFFSGERVKLRRVQLTGDLLASVIEKSVNRMMNALKNAWETKPDDKETEKRLLEIMKKTQQLRKETKKIAKKIREVSG